MKTLSPSIPRLATAAFANIATLALATLAALAACSSGGSGSGGVTVSTIIDAHVHFYDPSRPIPPGRDRPVPFPPAELTDLYRTILPADYIKLAQPLGVTGTIVMEASSWLEDNQWILDLAAQNPLIVGFMGNLDEVMGKPGFDAALEPLKRNPLFRGIRADVGERLSSSGVLKSLKSLADADLMIETHLTAAQAARLATQVPNLRAMVPLPGVDVVNPPAEWFTTISDLARQPNVFLKIVGLTDNAGPTPPSDPAVYRPILDHLYNTFGEDRLVYGSNWPVCSMYMPYTPLPTVHHIVVDYVTARGQEAADKLLWKNAQLSYKWVQR